MGTYTCVMLSFLIDELALPNFNSQCYPQLMCSSTYNQQWFPPATQRRFVSQRHVFFGTTLFLLTAYTAFLLGKDLYIKLTEFLEDHLQQLSQEAERHTGRALLDFFVNEGKRYTTAARYIHHVFRFLNRHWIKRERDEGNTTVYEVYALHIILWHKVMLKEMRTDISVQLRDSVLELVEKQRNNEATVEYGQMREAVDFFASFVVDKEYLPALPASPVYFYRDHFEDPFLNASQTFYETKSKQLMAENINDIVEYMRKIAACLDQEVKRGEIYLPERTVSLLRECCCTALVGDYFDLLLNEFQISLSHGHVEDIARVSRLLSPIPGGLSHLKEKFREHIRKEGFDAVAAGMESLGPQRYVGELVRISTQYRGVVEEAFNDDKSGFMQSLNDACRDFVNASPAGASNGKPPELLVKYVDELLRNNIEERELESSLEAVTATLAYMENKDIFQKHYIRMLARRLLFHAHPSSNDAEASMVNHLEEVCGFDYANKLRRMLGDMQISKDLNTEFQEPDSRLGYMPGSSVGSYSILAANAWPLQAPETDFNPPVEVSTDCDHFYQFYKTKHEGHKLTWLWQLCRGELRTSYCKRPYIFHVSIYQMAVLLLFNSRDHNTYEEIQAATQLNPGVLNPILSILCSKFKVLLMSPEEGKPDPSKIFRLNYDIKFGKIKVNLNLHSTRDDTAENEKINTAIEKDRELTMQVCLLSGTLPKGGG